MAIRSIGFIKFASSTAIVRKRNAIYGDLRIFDTPIKGVFEKPLVNIYASLVTFKPLNLTINCPARNIQTFELVKTSDGLTGIRMTNAGLRDFAIEYARTGRAKCRLCEETIKQVIKVT